jgi:O-antigen/teichoic acid export membrane protein
MISKISECNPDTQAQAGGDSVTMARNQIRGSTLLVAGNILSLGITFLPHLLLVRYLSTEGYGHLAYALSLVAVCKTYALGFNEALSRFVPIYHTKQDYSKAFGTIVVVFAVTLLISTVFVTVFWVASGPILALLTNGREPHGLLKVLVLLIPLETLEVLTMNLFACFHKTRIIFWGRFIIPPAMRAIAIVLSIGLRKDLFFVACGYLFGNVVSILPFGLLLVWELQRENLFTRIPKLGPVVREIFGFSVPLMASNVVGLLGSSLPVLLLGYYHPIATVAYYRVVLPAAVLSNVVLANFMPLYMPSASRLFARGDNEGINHLFWQTSLWMSVLAFPVFLATFCFARPLTIFLYGERYAPSAPILALLSLGYFSNVIFGFNGVTLKVLGKIRLMVVLNVITPVAIVLFNLLLIPRFGALGAAAATGAGIIVQNLIRQAGLHYVARIGFIDRKVISFFLALASAALVLKLMQMFSVTNLYAGLFLATLASTLLFCLVKRHLNVAETFPEILRVPLIGRLLANS